MGEDESSQSNSLKRRLRRFLSYARAGMTQGNHEGQISVLEGLDLTSSLANGCSFGGTFSDHAD